MIIANPKFGYLNSKTQTLNIEKFEFVSNFSLRFLDLIVIGL